MKEDKNFLEELTEALYSGSSKALLLVAISAFLVGIGIGFLINL